MKSKEILILILIIPILVACPPDDDGGCTDPLASNYNPDASIDNSSCQYFYGGRDFAQIDVGAVINSNNEYDIYIDGNHIGRLLYYFPNGLSCGNSDSVGSIIEAGSHTIRAVGNGGTIIREGVVNLLPQDCLVVLIEELTLISNNGGGGGNVTGEITDSRDGKTYKTVTIGSQTWMAENLRFNTHTSGVWFSEHVNVNVYGYHYDWQTIMNGSSSSALTPSGVKGICPSGWHVPSNNEYAVLRSVLSNTPGNDLKSTTGWVSISPTCPNSLSGGVSGVGNGTNSTGFNAYPAGSDGGLCYKGAGQYTRFWTSEADSAYLTYQFNRFGTDSTPIESKLSCRCLKD